MKTIWSKIQFMRWKRWEAVAYNMTEVLRMGYKENEMVIIRKKKVYLFVLVV